MGSSTSSLSIGHGNLIPGAPAASRRLFDLIDWNDTSGETTILDSKGDIVRRGDMLAFSRSAFYHYALYLGHGMVIHVAPPDTNGTGLILIESIEDVRLGSKFFINNHDKIAADMCNLRPRSFSDILEFVEPFVGQEINYHVLKNNCEHYCTLWRYGILYSTQVAKANAKAGKAVGFVAAGAMAFGAPYTVTAGLGYAIYRGALQE